MQQFKARLLGVLIIVKVFLPFMIIGVALTASIMSGRIVKLAMDRAAGRISGQIEAAGSQVKIVRLESKRLFNEARNIRQDAKEFSQDVKDIVKPLKGALNGLSKSMATIARTIESVINAIVRAVNKLPFRDIPSVRLPNYFKVPAFDIDLPNANLEVSDEAYEAIRQLSEASYNVARDAGETLEEIGKALAMWRFVAQVTLVLVVLWLLLGMMGYMARSKQRLLSGWKLIRGEPVDNAMALL